ncbi:uncharacterized protein si:dkey-261h17.1 [Xiphias gladius]|uniref:uncharacterized protein si:dkey-261h17.1 n=1 Tax=Xiphias gladius TaxID=8245 RepID=UPI001A99EAA9|nr:uncharacterized protein si:dkey-261h17.1 [Xiphias gladius]
MAVSVCRMNGLWRRMAGVLVLCTVLFCNEVMCQVDITTDAIFLSTADPAADASAATGAPAPGTTAATSVGPVPTVAGGADSATSASPGNSPLTTIVLNVTPNADRQGGDTSGTSGTTPGSLVRDYERPTATESPDESLFAKKVVLDVKCVLKENITESNAVKAVVATEDCEATKSIIQEHADNFCRMENCSLEIFQDGNTVLVTSKDVMLGTLARALQSEQLKKKLGVTKTEIPKSGSGSSVFVGILVTGLLAALGITAGYFKCQRTSDTKEVRLAEEGYPVDQENQGNTLLSVAPLNPPPDNQEKPSVNGESLEAAKTQPPPPTNGHSTTKTADTEL